MTDPDRHTYCEETKQVKLLGDRMYLDMGKRLARVRDEKLYEPEYSSFSEFCWEMRMDDTKASKLITTYNKLVKRLGISEEKLLEAGGWSNIYEFVPLVETKRDAEKWLEIVATHTRPDIRKFIKEAKTGVDMSKCSHKNFRILKLGICDDCGDSWKIHEDEQ